MQTYISAELGKSTQAGTDHILTLEVYFDLLVFLFFIPDLSVQVLLHEADYKSPFRTPGMTSNIHKTLGVGSKTSFCPILSSAMASPQRFVGNSMLQWNNMAAAGVTVPWHVELMFRTRQATATLLHISSSLQHNLTLQVTPTDVYFLSWTQFIFSKNSMDLQKKHIYYNRNKFKLKKINLL